MIRRGLFDTRLGQVHARFTDGDGRPLLALHMSPLSSRMWIPLMERIDRPVFAPDRLGFGFSDPPPRELTMDEYAAATLEAFDAHRGGGPFDIIGEHTGSVEAVAIAHLVPEWVGRIGLIALPVYTAEEIAARMETRAAPPVRPDADGTQFAALWKKRLAYREPPYDFDHLHDMTVQELTSAGPWRAYRAVFAYPMAERLRTLPVPAVVFAPDDDLAEQTARAKRLLAEGSRYIDLPDLSLDLFHEAPDRMVALIEQHLAPGTD